MTSAPALVNLLCEGLTLATTLEARLLEHLAVLLLSHTLATLLDNGAHPDHLCSSQWL